MEDIQHFPDYDVSQDIEYPDDARTLLTSEKWHKRSTKGNRKAQSARYYRKHKSQRADYMKRYMAARRAAQKTVDA